MTEEMTFEYQSKIKEVDQKLRVEKDLRSNLLKDKAKKENKIEKLEKKLSQLSKKGPIASETHE